MNYPSLHVYISNMYNFIPTFLLILAASYMHTEPVLWFAVIIILNILFVIYAWKLTIYTDKLAFVLKVIDLAIITVICLLMIIIFGVGDEMETSGYFSLGYIVIGAGVLLITNSFVRAFYYGYLKIS